MWEFAYVGTRWGACILPYVSWYAENMVKYNEKNITLCLVMLNALKSRDDKVQLVVKWAAAE